MDEINTGLDSEFLVMKAELFPRVWKFGVCVFETKSNLSFEEVQG
jgi:hypothetical protein